MTDALCLLSFLALLGLVLPFSELLGRVLAGAYIRRAP